MPLPRRNRRSGGSSRRPDPAGEPFDPFTDDVDLDGPSSAPGPQAPRRSAPREPAAPRGGGRGGRGREPAFELDFDAADDAGLGDVAPPRRWRTATGRGTTGGRTGRTDRTGGRGTGTAERRARRGAETPAGRAAVRRREDSGTYTYSPTTSGRRRTGASGDRVAAEIDALEDYESAEHAAGHTSERSTGGDLGRRILVAIPLVALAIFLVVTGGAVFVVGIAVFAVLCAWELARLLHRGRASAWAARLGTAAGVLAAGAGVEAMVGALVVALPLVFLAAVVRDPQGGAPGIATTLLGVAWIGLCFGHAVLLRDLDQGAGIIVSVLVGTFLGDTGAYLGGKVLGQRPLAPSISPNKTWEGLIIGWVVAVAAVWFAGLYQDWLGGTDALLLGLAVATVAPIGDLFESYVKRDAGAKDTGTWLGPHGGVLDRMDAVMFSIVAGYYVWLALGGGA